MCAAAALRLSPRLGRAFFELAACHEASGNYDAALRDVELAKGWVSRGAHKIFISLVFKVAR